MTARGWGQLALGFLTCAVVAVGGPAGADLYGTGWLRLLAALVAAGALVAGCLPWLRWERAEIAQRDYERQWRTGMDDLAAACGYGNYAGYRADFAGRYGRDPDPESAAAVDRGDWP